VTPSTYPEISYLPTYSPDGTLQVIHSSGSPATPIAADEYIAVTTCARSRPETRSGREAGGP
jgi:hypothetical protein